MMVCDEVQKRDPRMVRRHSRAILGSTLLMGVTLPASSILFALVGHGLLAAMAASAALAASIVVSARWIERAFRGGALGAGLMLAGAVFMAGGFLSGTKNLGMLPVLASSSLFVLLTVPHRDDADATISGATIVAASIIAAALMLRFG